MAILVRRSARAGFPTALDPARSRCTDARDKRCKIGYDNGIDFHKRILMRTIGAALNISNTSNTDNTGDTGMPNFDIAAFVRQGARLPLLVPV